MTLSVQPAIAIFDTARGEACGVAPVGVADPTFFAPITKTQHEAGAVCGVAVTDEGDAIGRNGENTGAIATGVSSSTTGRLDRIEVKGVNALAELGLAASYPYAFQKLLPKTRAAFAKVQDGVADARVFILGNSITYGAGTSGSLTANLRAKSYPTKLAALLTAAGTPSVQGSGNYNGGVTPLNTGDPRWSLGAGWANASGVNTLGGYTLFNSSTNNVLSFSPGVQFDTIKIWYIQNAGLGSFTVSVDGGATLGTVACNGSMSLTSATVTCPNTATRIDFTPTTLGTGMYIALVEVSLSTKKQVLISNFGFHGGRVANFVTGTGPWAPLPALTSMAPDLTVICMTTNDIAQSTSIPTFSAQMQTLIDAAKAGGSDVALMSDIPFSSAVFTATAPFFVGALKDLAAANGCPFVDMVDRWASYSFSQPYGFYFDTVHGSNLGAVDQARALLNILPH